MSCIQEKRRFVVLIFLVLGVFMGGATHSFAMDQMMPDMQDCASVSKCCDCTVPEISEVPNTAPVYNFESLVGILRFIELDFIPLSFYHPPK